MADLRPLLPSDYTDGRPDVLASLAPFAGGTVAQRRAEIERRRIEWAVADAAAVKARELAILEKRRAIHG